MNNAFSFNCIGTSLLSLLFGVIIFLNRKKAPNSPLVTLWSLFCFSVVFWSFGLGMMTRSLTEDVATYWLRIHYLGAILIPIVFLHFTLSFLNKNVQYRRTLIISYGISVLFQILSLRGDLSYVISKPPFTFYTAPGKYYNLYSIFFFFCVAFGFVLLYKALKKSEGFNRTQIQYFFLGMAIGFCGGSTAFLPVYDIPVFPFGMYLIALYILIVGFTIMKYRLMEFGLLMRWGLAFGSSLLVICGAFLIGIFISEKILRHYYGGGKGIPTVLAACLVVLIFEPVRRKVNKFVDQIIFQSPDFQALLTGIENILSAASNMESLCRDLTGKLKKIWGAEHVGFLIWDYKSSAFSLLPPEEFDDQIIARVKEQINRSDYLVKTLETERRLFWNGVVLENELVALIKRALPGEKTTFEKIRRTMRWLGADICVPLMFDEILLGFLILGKKKNAAAYNNEDKKFLTHLAEKLAHPIKNLLSEDSIQVANLNPKQQP